MSEINFDDAFLCHSMVSEKWLAGYLLDIRSSSSSIWDDELEGQLKDEIRHTSILKQAIEQYGSFKTFPMNVAIEIALYQKVANMEFPTHISRPKLNSILMIIEKRARFLYKMYLRCSSHVIYKEIISKILQDEVGHISSSEQNYCERTLVNLRKSEKFIFSKFLPQKYGSSTRYSTFTNLHYWEDLFNDRIHLDKSV